MGIFSSIKDAIFGRAKAKPTPQAQAPTPAPIAPAAPQPAPQPAPLPVSIEAVDVEAILTDLAQASGQAFNWRTSIVDLMKLLDLDSSLVARKDLAAELNYTGDTNDSATMNIWLHKQVMTKLAENGGKVPADLRN